MFGENREASGLLLVIWTRQRSSEMFVTRQRKAAVGCRPALVTGAVDGSFMGLTYGGWVGSGPSRVHAPSHPSLGA